MVFSVAFPEARPGYPQVLSRSSRNGLSVQAERVPLFSTAEASFSSPDGTRLAGTILTPLAPGPHPGVVLTHGSGAQDRWGDASSIDLLARRFVRAGYVVLQYDKRGTGASGGDWRSASFTTLAADALAGRGLLTSRRGVLTRRIGLAGSSQAGWISAKAVEMSPDIPFVLLIGAGGTAFTVQDQNAYNGDVNLRCAGVPEALRQQVARQHRLYYRAESEPRLRGELARVTARLGRDARIAPWLMPAEVDRTDPAVWYVAMETGVSQSRVLRADP